MPKEPRKGRSSYTDDDLLYLKQIGTRLKLIRERERATQDAFAELLALPPSTYKKYEGGYSFPKPETFRRLTQLGISMNFLLSGLGDVMWREPRQFTPRKASKKRKYG